MAAPFAVPDSEAALQAAVADACAEGRILAVDGAGSKRGLGRPAPAGARLSTAGLAGILYYEPGELVMEARAGTPLAEIEAALAANGQQLAFEPPDLGPLLGGAPGRGTIGGVFACNLSGPRRAAAGAARDHLLGVGAVSGRGESFAAGGRVVKNVTGYDMGKLLAGSFGTLAVLARVTFKVLPRAAAARTVLVLGAAPSAALAALVEIAGEPWEATGAAHLGADAAARSAVGYVAGAGGTVTALRLEGAREAVAARAAALRRRLAALGPTEELHTHNTRAFWRELRDGALLPPHAAGAVLWRLSLPPAAAEAARAGLTDLDGEWLWDWHGGLAWLSVPAGPAPEALAARVHDAAARAGGHAILWRADEAVRAAVPVFAPLDGALAALTRRLKVGFDPRGILNPGRMYAGL